MPRSILTDPDKIAGNILFGSSLHHVNLTELSKRTGISKSTLSAYRSAPGKIPLERLAKILNEIVIDEDGIIAIFRAYRGKK